MKFLIDALAALRYPKALINQRLLPLFHPMDVAETQTVVKAGDIPDKLFLIREGMGRLYSKKQAKGSRKVPETTRLVAGPGDWLTVPDAFVSQSPSPDQIDLMGESKVFYIDYDDYRNLCLTDHAFTQAMQKLWTGMIRKGFEREDVLKITNPMERRIDWLISKYGQIERYVPNRSSWASLLGISASTVKRYFAKRKL